MTEPTITCPNCSSEIKLTESLAAPLIADTRRQFEAQLAAKNDEIAAREDQVRLGLAQIEKAKTDLEAEVSRRLDSERTQIVAEETARAKRASALDLEQRDKALAEANGLLKDREAKLAEAQKAQAELLRKERELDDAKREMELTIERSVQASLGQVREKAKLDVEESLGLKMREKEEQIAGMRQQIEDLKRKAEQGSQQLQGEAHELELEETLRLKFPHDLIEPKGEFGGDLLQRVVGPGAQPCGTILWEAKRTKNWSDSWLTKLRDDQRTAKAEIALIVSHALPKGLQHFDLVDGVWVAEPRCAIAVAIAIRQTLIQVAGARLAGEGQQTKMELIYNYLIGPRFRHRVEAIVERFSEMQEDLDRERKAMTRMWAKREMQISGAVEATAGMYGDLQGIAGRTLAEIEGLEMPLIAAPLT
jgi:hypothetical protein